MSFGEIEFGRIRFTKYFTSHNFSAENLIRLRRLCFTKLLAPKKIKSLTHTKKSSFFFKKNILLKDLKKNESSPQVNKRTLQRFRALEREKYQFTINKSNLNSQESIFSHFLLISKKYSVKAYDEDLARKFLSFENFYLAQLFIDNICVGSQIYLVDVDTRNLIYFSTHYDENYSRFSPGNYLLSRSIGYFASEKFNYLCLGFDHYGYKRIFATHYFSYFSRSLPLVAYEFLLEIRQHVVGSRSSHEIFSK
jgi:hypothetical protein